MYLLIKYYFVPLSQILDFAINSARNSSLDSCSPIREVCSALWQTIVCPSREGSLLVFPMGKDFLLRIIIYPMKKKLYFTTLAILVAESCLADDVPALKVGTSDGEAAVVLSELLSIKYSDSSMVINMKDGTKMVFALDDVIVMELGQSPTDINTLFSNTAETYVITDLQGKVVSKGKNGNYAWPTKTGVYILSVGEKSKKLIVK